MVDNLVEKGIAAIKAGDKEEARRCLYIAILSDPDNVNVWRWYYDVCETEEERLHCLEEILRIDPNNEKARLIGLDLKVKTPAPQDKPPEEPVTRPHKGQISLPQKSYSGAEKFFIGSLLFLAALLVVFVAASVVRGNKNALSTQPGSTQTNLQTAAPNQPTKIVRTELTDEEYLAYLQQKFGKVGNYALNLVNMEITTGTTAGKNYHTVVFEIADEDATHFSEDSASLDRKKWAIVLLNELKNHWQGEEVSGTLLWNYYSLSWYPSSECSTSGNTLLDKGWEYSVYYATVKYSPDEGDAIGCY